eukprot:37107-Prymnesium_polylepis.1
MLGLQRPAAAPSSAIKSRKAPVKAPDRSQPYWKTVRIVREHPVTPNVECLNCSKIFCAGATRLKEHILNGCTCETAAFLALKDSLTSDKDDADAVKRQRTAADETRTLVQAGEAEAKLTLAAAPKLGVLLKQPPIEKALNNAK